MGLTAMDSVHFRLNPDITQIVDAATNLLKVFDSRSGGLRQAVIHAILDDLSAQQVYDKLVTFGAMVEQFRTDADHLIGESIAGNSEPLRTFLTSVEELLAVLPSFWQKQLYIVLRTIPEFRVIERCLEMAETK